MSWLTDEELQAILDRECHGFLASGFGWSALDIVDGLIKEILKLRWRLAGLEK